MKTSLNIVNHSRVQSVLTAVLLLTGFTASGQTDSLVLSLDSASVIYRKTTASLKGRISDNVTWDMDIHGGAPKILGTADPIRFVNMLPGVQTASEFDGGIHILGTDASQNEISIQGVPVYGANHMFGLFSVFIPSHFSAMQYSPDSDGCERLGGMVNMLLPDDVPEKTGGEFSTGLLTAQGTLTLPVGKRSAVFASGRSSFLNTFYKGRMTLDGGKIGYGFSDCNLTWLYRPDSRNALWVNGFHDSDKASLDEEEMGATLGSDWGNTLGSVQWSHTGDGSVMEHKAYTSTFGSKTVLDHELMQIRMPSRITTYGYDFKMKLDNLEFGLDARYHDVLPQYPEKEDGIDASCQHAVEAVPFIFLTSEIFKKITCQVGLRSLFYISPESKTYFLPEPSVRLSGILPSGGELTLKAALKHQDICRTGISQSALPIEFHYLAGSGFSAPQSALNLRLSYDRSLLAGLLSLSASAYFTELGNQVEYTGHVYDLLSPSYEIPDMLSIGKGRNYGMFFMLSKRSGRFTGWAGYAFSRARRFMDGPDGAVEYPSSHDRTHEFNLVCDYKTGRFDFGTSFVAATGTPFTAPDYFFICSGRVMSHYNSQNANRLDPYVRMDISADCLLMDNGSTELGMNLSVNNVLCRKNAIYYSLHTNGDGQCYRKTTFLNIGMMPSVSIYLKF